MYIQEFKNNIDIAEQFSGYNEFNRSIDPKEKYIEILTLLEESFVYLAWYDRGSYDGNAWVIYKHNGRLYENHGGHCSCYGLEDQWSPDGTSWETIRIRNFGDQFVDKYIQKLCNAQIGSK